MEEEKRLAERKKMEERAKEEMKRKMEEQKEERKGKRIKVINELIQTEKDFLTSLNLIMETFLAPSAEVCSVQLKCVNFCSVTSSFTSYCFILAWLQQLHVKNFDVFFF